MNNSWFTGILSAGGGAILLAIINWLLNHRTRSFDEATKIRSELRTDLEVQRKRADDAERRNDILVKENALLTAQITIETGKREVLQEKLAENAKEIERVRLEKEDALRRIEALESTLRSIDMRKSTTEGGV